MPRDDAVVPDGGLSGAPEGRRHDLASDLWTTNRPLRDDRPRSPLYTGPTFWPVPPSRPPPATKRATTSWGTGPDRARKSVTRHTRSSKFRPLTN